MFGVGGRTAVERPVGTAYRRTVCKLQKLDLAVHAGVHLAVQRHHLKHDVVQPPHLRQAFKLPTPHHCAPDRAPQSRLLQDEAERRCGGTVEDRSASHSCGHHPFHLVRGVRRLHGLEQGFRMVSDLQQPVDAVAFVDADLHRLGLQLGQFPHLLRIPDLLHVLPRRRDDARPEHPVGLGQVLAPGDPFSALDLVDQVLAVADGRPELGGAHARRLAQQLQLPSHHGDHGHAPLVVRIHLPPGLVRLHAGSYRLAVHRHSAPLRSPAPCRGALPVTTAPTARTALDNPPTVTARDRPFTPHGRCFRSR
ncbi:hypothetical protein STEPF1_06554 [Streptomyces sp. F-1]|nr:hypothetical protein STEPF1_06554 [Streptomyces sp. F-1]